MTINNMLRYTVIVILLSLCVQWSFGSAAQDRRGYPDGDLLADAGWLKTHLSDKHLVVADVRSEKHFDGSLIPGAVRLDWTQFRTNDTGADLASVFIGLNAAQKVLGNHGITRDDTIVLYDSVERDGGATASYVFWVLDLLGHEKIKILARGIDSWKDAGFDLTTAYTEPVPLLYQADPGSIRADKLINGEFIYRRLGDPYYQIIDVRSKEEYLGSKGTKGLDGSPLKLGHIPTAVNINYEHAWTDNTSKNLKSYAELQKLFRGLDTSKGVIVYCNSGRRSSFSYFVLRLMGVDTAITYEASWKEWGNPHNFFPVETQENHLAGDRFPGPSAAEGLHPAPTRSGPVKPYRVVIQVLRLTAMFPAEVKNENKKSDPFTLLEMVAGCLCAGRYHRLYFCHVRPTGIVERICQPPERSTRRDCPRLCCFKNPL